MGLNPPDMSSCSQKKRCLDGPNAGQLYNAEDPCPSGTTFDKELCDCVGEVRSLWLEGWCEFKYEYTTCSDAFVAGTGWVCACQETQGAKTNAICSNAAAGLGSMYSLTTYTGPIPHTVKQVSECSFESSSCGTNIACPEEIFFDNGNANKYEIVDANDQSLFPGAFSGPTPSVGICNDNIPFGCVSTPPLFIKYVFSEEDLSDFGQTTWSLSTAFTGSYQNCDCSSEIPCAGEPESVEFDTVVITTSCAPLPHTAERVAGKECSISYPNCGACAEVSVASEWVIKDSGGQVIGTLTGTTMPSTSMCNYEGLTTYCSLEPTLLETITGCTP